MFCVLAGCASLALTGPNPTHANEANPVVALEVEPRIASIHGLGNTHHVLFTGVLKDGDRIDLTAEAKVSIENSQRVRLASPGLFQALGEGISKIRVNWGKLSAEGVIVIEPARNAKIDFATQVAPIFSKAGCNGANCHGALNGQNGFKLSLFGYDPELDYDAVVHSSAGRRINRSAPEKSLLLLKPTLQEPHGGGLRFEKGSAEYELLLKWIGQGTGRSLSGAPRLVRLETYPKEFRVLQKRGSRQQIVVTGHFSDGSRRDVTHSVRYSAQNESVVSVTESGLLEAKDNGETSVLIRLLGQVAVVRIGVALNEKPLPPGWKPVSFIDELVLQKLHQIRIEPSGLCPDSEFIRRVFLDITGTLPTATEVESFLHDGSSAKRSRLVDRLLERREYGEFWALKWGDLLANSAPLVRDNTAYLQDWLCRSLQENKPYDQLVREILTAEGNSQESGEVNFFYRGDSNVLNPEDYVTTAAQAFMGLSLECARCHDHPFENWKRDDFLGMAAFFSQVERKSGGPKPTEAVFYVDFDREYRHPESGQILRPRLLDGTQPVIRRLQDRREVLAQWITSPQNPWFARATVNRVWRQLMGRGLVEPVDDMRETNPATHPELLARLAADFAQSGFDLKALIRTIVNSHTYQLSSVPAPGNRSDAINYSHYYLRRLTAEQLLDAIQQVTGVPEKFFGYYPGARAISLADPGVPSRFMDAHDRPPRDASRCERNETVSLTQSLHWIAGETLSRRIRTDQGVLMDWIRKGRSDREIIEELFLSALARHPSSQEIEWGEATIRRSPNRDKGLRNVMWAVLNTNEFLYNH